MHTYICTFLVHTHTIDVYNTHRHKKHVKRRYSMGPHMNPTWIAWFQELLNSVAPGSASLATAAAALPAVAVPPAVPAVLGKHRSCCSGRKGKWLVEWNHKYIYIQYGSLNYKCMVGWWWYVSKIHMAGGFVLVWVEGIVLVYHSLDLASSGTENRISSSDGVGWQCTAATVVDHLCRQLRWRKAYVGYVKGARIWVYDMMVIYFYNVIYHTHI